MFGYSIWQNFQPLGEGTAVLDLEDFIVSNILLPLGSLVYLLFCTSRWGWGFKNYQQEANYGTGLKVPNWMRIYVSVIVPIAVIIIFLQGIL